MHTIAVFRYLSRAGSDDLVREEAMHTTYAPSGTVVCVVGPGA